MDAPRSRNVVWHAPAVRREDRERLSGHKGVVLWLTGLSGSGKSTLAHEVEARLHGRGVRTYVLDGDNVRHGLNRDLGFSRDDREENIRRIGEVAKLFVDAGVVALAAFISPYRADRDRVRQGLPPGRFVEIYVRCPLEVCAARDPKGLYSRAGAGEIPQFTGLSDPYEEPESPELVVDTGVATLAQCASKIVAFLEEGGYLSP